MTDHRAWEIREAFGLDRLELAEREPAPPGPGEALVELEAWSLNYRDLLMVRGHYNPRQPLPLVPGSDGAGRVLAVGPGVARVAVGDRVAPIFAQRWLAGTPDREALTSTLGGPLPGSFCRRRTFPADGLVVVPDYLSDVEAATLPCAAVTAWSALNEAGRLRSGDTVLILGTGGVALFALQIAVSQGARVLVTSSSDAKLERVRELGAWQGINYRTQPEWGREARRLTSGRGVDQVIELGGAGTLDQSLRAVRPGGTISAIGVLAGGHGPLSVVPILMQQIRLQGILVGHRQAFESMLRAFEAHQLRPVVDRVFPFAELPAAFDHLASGRHFGKIALET